MRINPTITQPLIFPVYTNLNNAGNPVNPANLNAAAPLAYTPSVIMKISPEARALYNNTGLMSRLGGVEETPSAAEVFEAARCLTCEGRRYVDQSADGSVSFQTPASISPEAAPAAVMAHESEHLYNERDKAEKDGRRVAAEFAVLHMDICPECGRAYVAGGEARTITVPKNRPEALRAYEAMQNMVDTLFKF